MPFAPPAPGSSKWVSTKSFSNAGVRRTELWEYESAITDRTAGIAYVLGAGSSPPLPEVAALAQRRELPLIVDAAAELPPRENLKRIPATGADLVAFSGGKAIRGPQSTGILCGRRELISAAALQMLDMDDHLELWDPPDSLIDRSHLRGIPRHGIGRGLKVSKEEIVALLTSLEMFRLRSVRQGLSSTPVVSRDARRRTPQFGGRLSTRRASIFRSLADVGSPGE